jgi:hypothetical protein
MDKELLDRSEIEPAHRILIDRPEPTPETPQGMCLDKGDDFDEVCDLAGPRLG